MRVVPYILGHTTVLQCRVLRVEVDPYCLMRINAIIIIIIMLPQSHLKIIVDNKNQFSRHNGLGHTKGLSTHHYDII